MNKGNLLSEFSAEEISTLVNLIKENNTTSVKGLYIEALYPNIYKKLDKIYFKKAYSIKMIHRLLKDYQNDCYEHATRGLMYYCEDNHGFSYKFKPEEYFDDIDLDSYNECPETYDDEIDEVTRDVFSRWLYDYLEEISDDEAYDFFFDIIYEGIDNGYIDYTVKIPYAIIQTARSSH